MTPRVNHLLACLAEECGEVVQAVCKAQRFGLDDRGPTKQVTNREDIATELLHIMAVGQLLIKEGVLQKLDAHAIMEDKKTRVLEWMRRCGVE